MFSNFVSLGTACPVASSMSKYGLRSFSGPFDWLITSRFDIVLHYLENDFKDFLEKSKLESIDEAGLRFKNSGGVVFLHEEYPFKERYDALEQKYRKRIDRFLRETEKRTCFLRFCANSEEISYILENYQYIEKIIKKRNNQNEIIFLIKKDYYFQKPLPFQYYIMPVESPGKALRNYFDGANQFLDYCAHHFDAVSMMRNLEFDVKKRDEETQMRIKQRRYETLLKLFDLDCTKISIPKDIIIYGAGNIGVSFYKKVKGICNTICFVDRKRAGEKIDDLPIIKVEELDYGNNADIIVTATYDYDNISEEIKRYRAEANIISLDVFL